MHKGTLAYLQRLLKFGSSIEISWAEDSNMWTLAWISGGKRYIATEEDIYLCCVVVLNQAARDNYLAHLKEQE